MNVGMVSLRWLPEAIGLSGDGLHLLELYTNKEWDGWAKIISQGGTCTWESWDAPDHNQSLSHPWGAVGLLGIQNYMIGMKTINPQNEVIQIKSLYFENQLTFVEAVLPSDRGDVKIFWEKGKRKFTMKVNIPDNMKADIFIPVYGSSNLMVNMNGNDVKGIPGGGYIKIESVGSGSHFLVYEF